MADTFLERIVASTRTLIAERAARTPLYALDEQIAQAPAPRDFVAALRPAVGGSARLIAEVKRASPSKGMLAETFEPERQARAYAAGGAAAISVLTEPEFFLGSLDHLRVARRVVDVPVLRKDFVVEPYQIYEARAAGADALLLIVALLDAQRLRAYLGLTRELGMEALVETHDAAEVAQAVACGARVIGVNSRDLRTFAVNTAVCQELRPLVPYDCIFVAESGIGDARGVAQARAYGADAVLVGEALMRAADPVAKARELAEAPGGATARFFRGASGTFVKICGVRQPEHAAVVAATEADAFGVILAASRRQVTVEQAQAVVGAAREVAAGRQEGAALRAVGVFVNEEVARIAEVAATVGLDAVQLSGNEEPTVCAAVAAQTGLPVVKAVRLRDAAALESLDAYALAGATLLVDAPTDDGGYGGAGVVGDWSLAALAARRWPIMLAGGLTPTNVAAALDAVRPQGVDVSSGVEVEGVKDAERIRAFVRAAKMMGAARLAPHS